MNISYRVEHNVDAHEVAELYRSAGLRRPVDDLSRIGRMIANANLIICARDGTKLVGIARALTDFSYCCYLSDLAVDPDYQRLGIGRELIERTRAAIGDESMLLLLASPEAQNYYPHIGFEAVHNGWIIARTH